MTDLERMTVAWIRQQCALAFECARDVAFFSAHALPGESADETILRVFDEQRAAHPAPVDVHKVLDLMIYG